MTINARIGDWFLTFTGKQFYPLDPTPEDICIEDIAHALSNICRFGGHSRKFYSVAQHSLHVSRMVHQEFALEGLMHDATEAYCGDCIRPIKRALPDFKAMENRIWYAIARKWGLPLEIGATVKHFDDVALMTERRDLIAQTDHDWSIKAAPDKNEIYPEEPEVIEQLFLDEFWRLFRKA